MADDASERRRIRQLIQQAGVAMLMTLDEHGAPVGRPMLPLLLDDDPHVYFLTHQSSRKVTHLGARPRIAMTAVSAGSYLVVTGSADLSRDPALIRRLWHPTYRAWFPDGADDHEATVLRVIVDRVDYWEPPRSRFSRLIQVVTAVATHRAVETPMNTIAGL